MSKIFVNVSIAYHFKIMRSFIISFMGLDPSNIMRKTKYIITITGYCN